MVENQIRTNKVTDPRLIAAMAEIPRERFAPKRLQGFAYIDEDIEIAQGRYLMEPMVLARLLQTARVKPDDVALDIGCATGYSSAVLGRLAGTVVALEEDESLAKEAMAALSDVGADNVIVVTGPFAAGYPRQAPYDVILVNGAMPEMPDSIAAQLGEGGRLVSVMRRPGSVGEATLWAKYHGQLSHRPVFDAAIPWLPGMEAPAGFQF